MENQSFKNDDYSLLLKRPRYELKVHKREVQPFSVKGHCSLSKNISAKLIKQRNQILNIKNIFRPEEDFYFQTELRF